ncbi:HsdM family class I SAM-dependent methyltransferase [Tenacibaculum sp. M341]|uniref:HsdM family class I SAM-dependent methyltransferase n=1 Tax=Tenacibaculum sp. M341 TaxID=2530339 RepID=UPI00104DD5D3|nr:N-6 DNA methylase [Tenacibaculum sp. M341]TCI93746.1 hypothetical protein EYW44_04840 [Tenacibaculum sp. M341]
MKHLKQIFEKLGLNRENGLYIAGEQREKLFSNRIEKLLKETIKPNAFFCIDNKPFILFFENLGKYKEKKLKDIWNFNESPIVIICEKDNIEIFNGFEYLSDQKTLKLFGNEEKLNDFSYFELVTGQTWEKYEKSFGSKNRVDFYLLENIKATRNILISHSLSKELTNSLIGKVIFVRYLIDRGIKLDFEQQGESREWTNQEFCDLLNDKNKVIAFFSYLKSKFNGDLFPITQNEIENIPYTSFSIIIKLLSGEEIATNQLSLFNLYDFSIIPVEFISNIYELFIGQDQQEKQGAYYTPLFLVDYILAETVERKIQKNNDHSCKVLDPACGSGIFLVETLRKIIEQYQKNNPNYLNDIDSYKKDLKKLALDNIYGVDKDKSAINVAVFSIYLTLLDYQKPSDIENFKFPNLENKNFFSSDFFDTNADFNTKFQNIEFNFILGNPPWKRGKGGEKSPLFIQYIKNRQKREKGKSNIEIKISNKEIAQAFVLRTSDFSSKNTNISLVVTSKMLYNLNAKQFRQYFLENFFVDKIFELAPVRKEVFNESSDSAIAPAAVLFYRHTKNQETNNNLVQHITLKPSKFFSLFKIFTIQRGDYKEVLQEKLKTYDYLWKVLVYGSYLDFNLINRLNQNFKSISEIISDSQNFVYGQGIQISGGDENDVSRHIGKKYINSRKDIKSFWINSNTQSKWTKQIVHRQKEDILFEGPMILISKGFTNTFRCVSGYSEENVLFTDTLTSIKSVNNHNSDYLKIISGILNSIVFTYLNLQTFSSSGIEREQSHNKEKFSTPFTNNNLIEHIYNEISYLKKKKYSSNTTEIIDFDKKIATKIQELDNTILSAFSFSKQERDLVNYATDITIPLIMKHKGYERIFNPLQLDSEIITEYIYLFFNAFNPIYKKLNQQIIVEIKYTNQIIGLFFKLTSLNSNNTPIKKTKEKNTVFLKLLSSLGVEKVTDKLFIQKDIRGFEENGFYIIKPNEQKLWHKAIGHLDVNEFMDAVLMAGKKNKFNV